MSDAMGMITTLGFMETNLDKSMLPVFRAIPWYVKYVSYFCWPYYAYKCWRINKTFEDEGAKADLIEGPHTAPKSTGEK